MYSQDGALVLKDGVVFNITEIIDLLNKLQKVSDKWDKLDEEIGKFYEITHESSEEETETLLDIGELCCKYFGYL